MIVVCVVLALPAAGATPPNITTQPISAVVGVGQPASLSVSANGGMNAPPQYYQWIRDGVILTGQTNDTLTYASFQFTNSGCYSVVITNALGMAISIPASLSITNAPLWGWGNNNCGQLGNGTNWGAYNTNRPFVVTNDVVTMAAGYWHSLFLKADGTLWAMGTNSYGQLGNGKTVSTNRPIYVTNGVATVAAGTYHSLFVKVDGTLWSMGRNNYGQLGNGTTNNSTLPVYVTNGVVAVAAATSHSLFVKADGTLWSMGANNYGQLGNGTTNNSSLPVYVTNGVAIAPAAGSWSLFVKADSTFWAMGRNMAGQLGIGTSSDTNRPVYVTNNVIFATGGGTLSLFAKTDGTLWGTGDSDGMLFGNAQIFPGISTRRPINLTNNVATIATTDTYYPSGCSFLFLKTDGTLWGVGGDAYGELGDGGSGDSSDYPVQSNTGALLGASLCEGGGGHVLAIAIQPLTVTVNFTQGTASPSPGVYSNYIGSILTNTVISPIINNTTQYVCAGWSMTGNAPANGSTTQCVMTVTNNAVLTWLWTTNYWLEPAAGPNGALFNTPAGWRAMGSTPVLDAIPNQYYTFTNWTGSVSSVTNPLSLLIDGPKSVTANFAPIMVTNAPVAVPQWWLAQYGLTNFTVAITNDTDHDGVPNWAEYVAGSDPTSRASVFAITNLVVTKGTNFVIAWPSVAGRMYALDSTTNLLQSFAPLTGATNLPATPPVNVYTNTGTPALQIFYRLRVWMP